MKIFDLVERRNALKISAEDLADGLGIDRRSLRRYERRERTPDIALVVRWARALRVSLSRIASWWA